jgi:hypothetical protein
MARKLKSADPATYVVYKHTCTVNGKAYVGFTKLTVEARFGLHLASARTGSNVAFHCAIRKHGHDAWTHEELEIHRTKEAACQAEVRLIVQHGTRAPHGYNMTLGGEGGELCDEAKVRYYAAVRSPEMSAKRRANSKRAFQDPVVKQRHHDAISRPEARSKQSAALKQANARPEVKARRCLAQAIAQNAGDVNERRSASLAVANGKDEVHARRSCASAEVQNRDSVKRAKRLKMSKPLEQLDAATGEVVARFPSVKAASEQTGVHYSNINGCALGNRRIAGGFRWRYL